ncbi:cytochrome c biogenesis CcdA family protein [Natronolimnohabitans innermongolicus]|uniref:Cytochrome c biogenesis protein transmembrane region n=1 Tax=Natronolimnohabitans innermongolicus JCM 12255 TaxID=1227499 RepID=L9WKI8_9EURY|nr:cytochrome c biogenesis protein CcdA [Natronolimnohabitans innermongolicus]ELY48873.1 cytochrome c biogenesis protein transmembrane region [Natronolimnohabitans innermongolicus JCM 12255]
MFDGSLPLAFALTAGIATFFSPCAYPLLPGYVGFYVSQTEGSEPSLSGALSRGLIAGAGVLVTFGVLFVAAYWIGHSTLSNIVLFEPLVGAILVIFGLLVVFDRAPSLSIALPKRRSSVLGFGIFGAGYALAAAGCVAPLFVAVVAQALSLSPGSAALVLGTYAGSVVVLMVSLTIATGMGLVAGAGRLAAHSETLKRLAGAVMILAGIGQLYLAIVVLEVF